MLRLGTLLGCVLWVGAPVLCRAQTPDAAAVQAPTAWVGSGILRGEVTDVGGGLVPGAQVVLTLDGTAGERKTITDDDGEFLFEGVAAGSFTLKVTAEGMQPGGAKGELKAGEAQDVPPIVLRVGSQDTEVEVTFTREELGVAEVQAEEHQRVLGIFPNFGVTYDWNAPPLTTPQKYDLAWKAFVDPVTILITAGVAGVEQAANELPGYGQGVGSYGKRFAANTGNNLFGAFLTGAVLPQIFKQDPRYFWKGSGTKKERTIYALESVVMCRADSDGHWETNYSNLIGSFGAGALSNLYYPNGSRQGATLTIENGLIGLAEGGLGNIVQEFLLHHLTPKLPRATPAPLPHP